MMASGSSVPEAIIYIQFGPANYVHMTASASSNFNDAREMLCWVGWK